MIVNSLIFCLMMCASSLFGQASEQLAPQEPLPLDLKPAFTMTQENRNFMSTLYEAERNVLLFSEKSFPIYQTLAFLSFLSALILGWKPFVEVLKKKFFAPLSPQQKAFRALQALKKNKMISKGFFDEAYVQTIEILRKYLQDQYHLPTEVHTTEEFLRQAEEDPIFNQETKELFKRYFSLADMVKFAHYHPSQSDCESVFSSVEQFVTNTKKN